MEPTVGRTRQRRRVRLCVLRSEPLSTYLELCMQCSALRPIVTCSSYSTCSTCAQVSVRGCLALFLFVIPFCVSGDQSCKWIATLSIFNSSGQCLPSTSTYSVITFPYSYSSSGSVSRTRLWVKVLDYDDVRFLFASAHRDPLRVRIHLVQPALRV